MERFLNSEVTVTRPGNPKLNLLDEMYIERGDKDDWLALHELHYKSTGKTTGRVYKTTLHGYLVGVTVMTPPRGVLRPRHDVFPHIRATGKDTRITNVHRFKWLNKNCSLNSRTVVDNLYRGVGVAYRMLNLTCRMEGMKMSEIQSSMSRYNLFAQKAGFSFAKLNRSPYYDEGIDFFYMHFDSNPMDLVGLLQERERMSEKSRKGLDRKLRMFYFERSSLERGGVGDARKEKKRYVLEDMPIHVVLKNCQQLIFAAPMYGFYMNPDENRKLPARLPLSAFDRQKTTEPLVLTEEEKKLC